MSIVNYVKDKLPEERTVVYCDNSPLPNDRAIFKNGSFIGGGEFPVKEYHMKNVTKWFDYELYSELMEEKYDCYSVSFDLADTL
jgi:hypothetical protein